jgi:hypothetical protein
MDLIYASFVAAFRLGLALHIQIKIPLRYLVTDGKFHAKRKPISEIQTIVQSVRD